MMAPPVDDILKLLMKERIKFSEYIGTPEEESKHTGYGLAQLAKKPLPSIREVLLGRVSGQVGVHSIFLIALMCCSGCSSRQGG